MLFNQNSSFSFVSLLIILGSYQESLLLISFYMFLLKKKRTKGTITKRIDESCLVIFVSFLRVENFCINSFVPSESFLYLRKISENRIVSNIFSG